MCAMRKVCRRATCIRPRAHVFGCDAPMRADPSVHRGWRGALCKRPGTADKLVTGRQTVYYKTAILRRPMTNKV